MRYWDLETGETLKVLSGHTDTVLSVAFSPDGHKALSGSTDKTLRLWDLTTRQLRATLQGPPPEAAAVELHLKGKAELVQAWVVSPHSQARGPILS